MSRIVARKKKPKWPQEPLLRLENPIVDARGYIQPLVETIMRSAMVISSKPGAVRGNHYHKTDWHYCYMISGEMEYYYRSTGNSEPPKRLIVRPGQLLFTPPMVDHAFKFYSDSLWVTLSRNPRDQDSYEKDVVRIALIGG